MVRRGLPKPVAGVIAALLALYFVPLGATPAAATEPTLTLQGCRGSAADFPADGPFVCADGEYTTGNLQKLWNELDLVPFRITSNASAGDTFPFTTTLAADYLDNGNKGYDVISEPVVNEDLSDASCEITAIGPLLLDQASLGGSDFTIRRTLTWTQSAGDTCVFDYYQRLALGAAAYPGSNLQAYLGVDNGKKTVPLPVGAILPQQLSKTMSALQGSTYAWTVAKTATPSSVTFANTCADSGEARSANVNVTLSWTRSAQLGEGAIALHTQVTAHNPAHRPIKVSVSDQMYEGSDQTKPLGAPKTDTKVAPAGGDAVFTFDQVVTSSATTFNDVATATYIDEATDITVPGNTTASASTGVTVAPASSGATATISDVETMTGDDRFTFTVNTVTATGPGSPGSFSGYDLGDPTTGPVTWSSTITPTGTGAASGTFSFGKVVQVEPGTVGTGTLSDTVTLTPAGQTAQTASASVAISADAANPTLRFTKTVDLAPDSDATFTFAVRAKDGTGAATGPTYTFTVTIPAGQTTATSGFQSVAPSASGYLYTETAAAGYTGQNGSIDALAKCDVKTVTVGNTRNRAPITVTKNLIGAANGASTSFTFDVDCPGTAYDQKLTVAVTNGTSASATTGLIPTGLTCTVTEPSVPDWKLTQVVPANGAVQPGQTVTFTNTRLAGTLNIVKAVSPVAGNGVVVEFGDTLTYTLTVSATGEQRQPNVVVTDFLPGRDPARPASGHTTYVAGSAACVDPGTCTVSGPDASGKLTWQLGEMAAGTTRKVTFKVTIDDVSGRPGETVAVDILNAGAVRSDRTPTTPSNVVRTPVSKVLPIKIPRELPRTGAGLPIERLLGGGLLVLGLGVLLLVGDRKRWSRLG